MSVFLSSLHFCFLRNSPYLTFARSLFMIADHYSQARILTYNQCHSGRQYKRSVHRNGIAPFGLDLTSQKHAFPVKHDPKTSLSYTTKRIQDVLYKHYFRQICHYNERTNSIQLKWEIFCIVNDNCFQFSFTVVCLVLTERILFNSFLFTIFSLIIIAIQLFCRQAMFTQASSRQFFLLFLCPFRLVSLVK